MQNIFWTDLARETYAGLLLFLLETASERRAFDLDERVEKLLLRLSKFRFSCPPSPKIPRFRRCVIDENASLIYEIVDKKVFVVAVVDNRAEHLYF